MSSHKVKDESITFGDFSLALPILDLDFPPTSEYQGYSLTADSFMRGAIALMENEKKFNKSQTLSINCLAGFSLECFLKAYLCKSYPEKFNQKVLSKKLFGHDLKALWSECSKNNLPMPVNFPDSEVDALNSNTHCLYLLNLLHCGFVIRYPIDVNSLLTPNMNEVISYLEWFSNVLK